MRRVFNYFTIILFILIFIAAVAFAKEMTVQVNKTQLRSTPAYYGSVVSSVSYADRLTIIDTKGSWVKASSKKNKNISGWVHISALTTQILKPKSGSTYAPTSVSTGELSAAEKGFTEQIEKEYRKKNKNIDFTWVDRMEKLKITPQQSASFLKDGQVEPSEGGAQ